MSETSETVKQRTATKSVVKVVQLSTIVHSEFGVSLQGVFLAIAQFHSQLQGTESSPTAPTKE